jgi:hypothetical protein
MRRYSLWCGVALVVVPSLALRARAEAPAPRLVEETWHAAYFEGAKSGYVHTAVHEVEHAGRKYLRTIRTLNLAIKRYNSVVPVRLQVGTLETPDGKAVSLSMTHVLDKGRMVTTGQVVGEALLVKTPNEPEGREVPWKDGALGLYKQDHLFKERQVKPGDRFNFLTYELSLLAPVTIRTAVKAPEEVDVFETVQEEGRTRVERARKKLLRVELTADKVEVGENAIQLPKQLAWLDPDWRPLRYEWGWPGLGRITLYRTTREVAQQEGAAPALLPDLGLNTLVSLKQPIERPHDARQIVYRITVAEDDDPTTTFTRDDRQKVQNVKGSTFELAVRPVRGPAAPAADAEEPAPPKPEFLKSSYFLDSDNERVRALAARIVGDETDPWTKARRIEGWVREHMSGSNGVGFATASQIARDLQGDCRQHAMLTAALCRAAGVPSRTAVGLVYVDDPDRGPVFGFHMWTEVWIKGQWLGLDATLGRGGVGAAHLKIADHSWRDIQTLAPLLPVTRVLGKIRIEVVSVK